MLCFKGNCCCIEGKNWGNQEGKGGQEDKGWSEG